MKRVAASVEDDECWDIAESMIDEIGLIKGKKTGKRSKYSKFKGNFKRMLMSRIRLGKDKKIIWH